MEMKKNTVPDISRQHFEKIEDHCKQMRSEAIADGVITLVSKLKPRDRKICFAPLKEKGLVEPAS